MSTRRLPAQLLPDGTNPAVDIISRVSRPLFRRVPGDAPYYVMRRIGEAQLRSDEIHRYTTAPRWDLIGKDGAEIGTFFEGTPTIRLLGVMPDTLCQALVGRPLTDVLDMRAAVSGAEGVIVSYDLGMQRTRFDIVGELRVPGWRK